MDTFKLKKICKESESETLAEFSEMIDFYDYINKSVKLQERITSGLVNHREDTTLNYFNKIKHNIYEGSLHEYVINSYIDDSQLSFLNKDNLTNEEFNSCLNKCHFYNELMKTITRLSNLFDEFMASLESDNDIDHSLKIQLQNICVESIMKMGEISSFAYVCLSV